MSQKPFLGLFSYGLTGVGFGLFLLIVSIHDPKPHRHVYTDT